MATLGFGAVGCIGLLFLGVALLSGEGNFGRWGPVGIAFLAGGFGMLFIELTGRWNVVSPTKSELWAAVSSLLLVVCAAGFVTATLHLVARGTFVTPAVGALVFLALAWVTIRQHFSSAPSKQAM